MTGLGVTCDVTGFPSFVEFCAHSTQPFTVPPVCQPALNKGWPLLPPPPLPLPLLPASPLSRQRWKCPWNCHVATPSNDLWVTVKFKVPIVHWFTAFLARLRYQKGILLQKCTVEGLSMFRPFIDTLFIFVTLDPEQKFWTLILGQVGSTLCCSC